MEVAIKLTKEDIETAIRRYLEDRTGFHLSGAPLTINKDKLTAEVVYDDGD
jgi:hypothetical protein